MPYLWIIAVSMVVYLLLGKQHKVQTGFEIHIINAIRAAIWCALAIALMFRFS